MQYLYYFANTSLVLRLLTYLSKRVAINLDAVTVIYLVDRWVVRIQLKEPLTLQTDLNFISVLRENGSPYEPSKQILKVLKSLDSGMSITDVMNLHHLVVVSHGGLSPGDIQDFRTMFVRGLGYCPPSLV